MHKKINIRVAAICIALFIGQFGRASLPLPIMNVNGKECYYYKAGKDDTVYGVAHKLGITRNDIITHNPWAVDGIAGGVLYFPVAEFGQPDAMPLQQTNNVTEHAPVENTDTPIKPFNSDNDSRELTPVNPPVSVILADSVNTTDRLTDVVNSTDDKTFRVSLFMRFMLDESKPGKVAQQATEFYRGFLLGIDTLGIKAPKTEINVYDTRGSVDNLRKILVDNPDIALSDVIIAPDAADETDVLAAFAKRNEIFVLNNVVARDSSYLINPYVLQGPIPTDAMYASAIDYFMNNLIGNATPVILLSENGKTDKKAFVDRLISAMALQGITPLYVNWSGSLTTVNLSDQLPTPDESTKYVFIPLSGTVSEFNHFANALKRYRNEINAVGADLQLFGYPEWITFRNDAKDLLHDLGAVIYSRSYTDDKNADAENIAKSFTHWYASTPASGVPSQALMGYDTAGFIMHVLSNGGFNIDSEYQWNGVQSTYNMQHNQDAKGFTNTALYIINFLAEKRTQATVI